MMFFEMVLLFASITLGLACIFLSFRVARLKRKQRPPVQTFPVGQVIREAESKLSN